MFPDEKLTELKNRISEMSDRELLQIVEVDYDDYRKEALEFAQTELTKRMISFERHAQEPDEDDEVLTAPAAADIPCGNCGGQLRSGLLFSERELTILFADNDEERFVQVLACSRCGEIQLRVDLDTDVAGEA